MKTQYGFDVRIKFKPSSPYGSVECTYHNVTEIHYRYKTLIPDRDAIAFESDIHATGLTHNIEYIDEFESVLAHEKHKEF